MRWSTKYLQFLSSEPALRPEVVAVRERLLDVLFLSLAVVGGMTILIGATIAMLAGQIRYGLAYLALDVVLVVGGLLTRKRSYNTKALLIIAVGMSMGVMTLFRIGLSGVGIEIVTTFTVLATVLFGLRRALLCLAIGVVAVIGAGVAYVTGIVNTPVETLLTSHNAVAWTNATIIFALFTFALILSPELLLRRLHEALDEQEGRANELDRSNRELKHEMDRRLRAERDHKKSESRFQELAELIPEAVVETDADGSLSYANRAACDIYGYSLQEFLAGRTLFDLLQNEERARAEQHVARVMDGDPVGLREYQGRRKDGTVLPVLVRLAAMQTADQGNGLRGFFLDVSEKKRLEQQLQQAQRLEALGTLAGGIAHDFNNLLTAIQGHASLLERQVGREHPGLDHLERIEQCVDSAASLTGRLLGLARGGKYEVLPADVNELTQTSVELFGRTRKEISIRFDLELDAWSVKVDRRQIEQVLLNLLVNSAQAMPSGGTITIQTVNLTLKAERAEALDLPPGDYVRISVADTGTGIDPEVLGRIFDPFFTTKEGGLGTGLGLASAYGIARNHGGTVEAQSDLGHGATLHVYLPAEKRRAPTHQQATVEDVPTGTETILVVDDETPVLTATSLLLRDLGYDVITAGSGQEALEALSSSSKRVDLVLLDMVMPRLSGSDVYEHIRSQGLSVKVLLSSGYSIDGEASRLLAEGCDGFLQKPYSVKVLANKVRQVLASPGAESTHARTAT